MKKNKLLLGFAATLIVAGILRFFVLDVILVSNDLLQPHFFPGDFLLVSKIVKVEEGNWVLLKNYPSKSVYSIRNLVKRQSEQGWLVVEPAGTVSTADVSHEGERHVAKSFVDNNQILGKAVMILWSLPCKPSVVASGLCPDKTDRFLKRIH